MDCLGVEETGRLHVRQPESSVRKALHGFRTRRVGGQSRHLIEASSALCRIAQGVLGYSLPSLRWFITHAKPLPMRRPLSWKWFPEFHLRVLAT